MTTRSGQTIGNAVDVDWLDPDTVTLRDGLTVVELCRATLSQAPGRVKQLGDGNGLRSFRVDLGDRHVKCYEVESAQRAELIVRATASLSMAGVAIPTIRAVAGAVIIAEWVEGVALGWDLDSKGWSRLADYQREIHSARRQGLEPDDARFLHLEWLLDRLMRSSRGSLEEAEAASVCRRIRARTPLGLEVRVVAPDFTPPNVVADRGGGLTLIDTEFLGIGAGFEFDVLNTVREMFPGDARKQSRYVEAYSTGSACGTLHSHREFWELCLAAKRTGKAFWLGDLVGGRKEFDDLERRLDGYGQPGGH